ncbi:MAG: sulfite exporter TauE/SafE family protein [Pseudomonadota bacterium]
MIEVFGIPGFAFAGLMASFLAGGLVKGMIGFGLPLVVVSLAPLFTEVGVFLAANAVVMPFSNAMQVYQGGPPRPTVTRFRGLFAVMLITLPLGVLAAGSVTPETLMLILGLVVMGFTALQAANPRLMIAPRHEGPAGLLTGALAGLIGGLTTVNGPIITLFAVGTALERRVMISLQGVAFLLSGLVLTIGYAGIGILDSGRVLTGLACILPAWAGMWLGNRLAARIPQALFRRIVLAVLFVAGGNLVFRALGG